MFALTIIFSVLAIAWGLLQTKHEYYVPRSATSKEEAREKLRFNLIMGFFWTVYWVGLTIWLVVDPGDRVRENHSLFTALIFMYFALFVCNAVPRLVAAAKLRIHIKQQ